MQNLLLSLNNNTLKITLLDKTGIKGTTAEVSPDIAKDSTVSNVPEFCRKVENLLTTEFQLKTKKPLLSFLVEPQDTYTLFLTVSKKTQDIDGQLISEINSRLEGVTLNELYFSYQKIAPFVYQFVGIKKSLMDNYAEIATTLGFSLQSVTPWIALLPKYINKNEPCIFISKNQTDQLVALSELNGIFFSAVFEKEKSLNDLQKLVSELSVYKREVPISKIYTINAEFFSLDPKCEVIAIKPEGIDGFELHMIYYTVFGADEALYMSQLNLLNALPLPVVENKNKSLVYVGGGVAASVAFLLLLVLLLKNNAATVNNPANDLALTNTETNVLSGEDEVKEPTPSVTEVPVLKKADLKIKVLNGSGTSGVAAKGRDFLNGLGYKVTEIGNADTNRDATIVMLKPSTAAYKDLLTADLKLEYSSVTFDTSLAETDPFGAIMIVGAK